MHFLIRITLLIIFLLAATLGARAQSASSSNSTAGGSISGRVTLSGKPMPGLMVAAQRTSNEEMPPTEPSAKATTDQDGRYQITGLAPGNYRVLSLSSVYVTPGNLLPGARQGKTVMLKENEHLDGIDFPLVRGAVITGKVIDATGRALIGERVTLAAIDEQGRKRPLPPSEPTMAEIDDRGVYRIFGLPAGRYIISAGQATDGSTSARIGAAGPIYRRIFHPNAIEEAQAKIIELNVGLEAAGIDIAMGHPTKTFAASGRVISAETGQPVPNMAVGYATVREGASALSGFGFTNNRTNAQGEFRLEGFLPGRYATFSMSGSFMGTEVESPDVYSEPVTFEISDSHVSNLEIKLHRGSSISGVIAVEQGGDPAILSQVSQFYLGAYPAAPTRELTAPMTSTPKINPDGSFRIAGLRPGKFKIQTEGPRGMELLRVERDGVEQRDGIEVGPGEQVTGVRLVIAGGGNGVIRGEVKIIGGALPEGVRLFVTAVRVNTAPSGPAFQVDERGRFMIEKLIPGDYEVRTMFSAPPSSGPRPPMPQLKQTVTVTNGAEAQVTLTLDLSAKDKEPQP